MVQKLKRRLIPPTLGLVLISTNLVFSQNIINAFEVQTGQNFNLYPHVYDQKPDTDSPITLNNGMEVLLVSLKNNKYAFLPVTVENGTPLVYSTRIEDLFGKDKQLYIDSGDFPSLGKTGLHSESELEGKKMITGFPVSLITYIGQPGRFSGSGFMAADEDIISVLINDNRIVKTLDLKHHQLAKPLFHVWNLILKEMDLGNWGRFWDNIPHFYYNGRIVNLKAEGGKGWQISIFQDEIKGRFNINVRTDLSADELAFLKEKYPLLSPNQFMELKKKLTHIQFSEMMPYYIMRYGFYEGHTEWRSDPVAISFVFGLKSIEEIERAFAGTLYKTLTDHFTQKE